METKEYAEEPGQTLRDTSAAPADMRAAGESEESKRDRIDTCRKLAPAALVFALLCTLLLYKNGASVAVPLFVLAAGAFILRMMALAGKSRPKRGTWFCLAIMLLLAVSDCLTDNAFIIACNNAAIFLVLLTVLLHNYCDDTRWAFGTYFTAMLRCVGGSLGCVNDAARDLLCWGKASSKGNKQLLSALAGAALSAPLLAAVIALLCSADGGYAAQLGRLAEHIRVGAAVRIFLFFAAAFLGAYCSTRFLWQHRISCTAKERRQFPSAAACTSLFLFCIVYVSFTCSQFTTPPGAAVRPAAYAREGFFQLLAVSIINVLIVQTMLAHTKNNAALKVLLSVFCVCTYLMIASAAMRMIRYISYYGALTFLRVVVLWALAVLALLLSGQVIQIFRSRFPLFRYGFTVVCVCYAALSLARPDYWIASYNLAHIERNSGSLLHPELGELRQLALDTSCDAAPAFRRAGYLSVQGYNTKFDYTQILREKLEGKALSPRTWNFSRAQARKLTESAD